MTDLKMGSSWSTVTPGRLLKSKHRRYVFYYHLNKPETKRVGHPIWTLHWRGKCHMLDYIISFVPTETKANRRQPWAVVRGHSTGVCLHKKQDGTREAWIYS